MIIRCILMLIAFVLLNADRLYLNNIDANNILKYYTFASSLGLNILTSKEKLIIHNKSTSLLIKDYNTSYLINVDISSIIYVQK